MKELHESWGRKVRQRREALGLTQDQVAEMTRLDQSTISRIERGKCPSDEQKMLLAAALRATPDLLFPYPPVVPLLPSSGGEAA
jgi:transcriptional regulator with XRE-family HTH domain